MTGTAVKERFVAFLKAVLANKEGPLILRRIEILKLFFIDSGDVADDVGCKFLVRIVPHHAGSDPRTG